MKDLIKEVALSVGKTFVREMEGYSYFGSNPGIPEDDVEEFATAFLAELSKRAEAIAWTNEFELDYVKNIRPDWDEPSAAMWRMYHEDSPIPVFTFPPIHDIEAIENRTAEACARLVIKNGFKYQQTLSEIRNQEWRKYK